MIAEAFKAAFIDGFRTGMLEGIAKEAAHYLDGVYRRLPLREQASRLSQLDRLLRATGHYPLAEGTDV